MLCDKSACAPRKSALSLSQQSFYRRASAQIIEKISVVCLHTFVNVHQLVTARPCLTACHAIRCVSTDTPGSAPWGVRGRSGEVAMDDDTEILVIGGGPARSTAAPLLARAGLQVRLLELERFARYQIGESFLASCLSVLRSSGTLEKVRAAEDITTEPVLGLTPCVDRC
jgi:Tryptophan halogenase